MKDRTRTEQAKRRAKNLRAARNLKAKNRSVNR